MWGSRYGSITKNINNHGRKIIKKLLTWTSSHNSIPTRHLTITTKVKVVIHNKSQKEKYKEKNIEIKVRYSTNEV